MRRVSITLSFLSILLVLASSPAAAQSPNLLQNPNAAEGTKHWRAFKGATVEEVENGNLIFAVRNGGYFVQEVTLPENTVGQYALLIGRASSERVDADGAISGPPTLYGYMMNYGDPSGGRINAYLAGQHMFSRAKAANEWVQLWGIFRVPPGTGRISFFLKQAEQREIPPNGSAARFDDLGLYLFPTEETARAFVGPVALVEMRPPTDQSVVPLPQCPLKIAQAPEVEGVRLGMTIEEALSHFSSASEDAPVIRAIEKGKLPQSAGFTWVVLRSNRYGSDPKFGGINLYSMRFLDRKLYSVHVEYNEPLWKHVDEFISKHAGVMNLPGLEFWVQVQGIRSKYLVCDGFEVKFFASPNGQSNTIVVTDLNEERVLTERRLAGGKAN